MATDSAESLLSLSVSLMTGEILSFHVASSEYVGAFRKKIVAQLGIAATDTVRLMHGDQVLTDHVIFEDLSFAGNEANLLAIVAPLYVYADGYYNHTDLSCEGHATLEKAIVRAQDFPKCVAICWNSDDGRTYFVSRKHDRLRDNGVDSWHWYDLCV
eukprot:TRINITY_DN50143_c0_g1_i1.p1 TRINITY_DN50143_c0_g1~~TRINITY_DN50143_c0_g1_i1.p1  ORF type:complete len:157 (+),score=29.19 TRINITY_DN50143_c0_g1_i1:66-536(+)